MLPTLRARLTYANVISTIALFCALAGGAYAANLLPPKSVGTAQLKKNAVTSPKVKDGTLQKKDFKPGQLPAGQQGPRGEAGPRGAEGPRGEQGVAGQRGPSNAYYDWSETQAGISSAGTLAASLNLPAGNWVITGKVNSFNNGVAATADCALFAGPTQIDLALFELQASGEVNELPVTVHAAVRLATPAAVQLICHEQDAPGVGLLIDERRLTAIQVETLTEQ
jgi:hypothetical protein